MRIALVCSEVIRESGHGRYMLELARRLACDHEVHVFSDLFDPVPGVTHHRVPAPIGINLLRVFIFWLRSSRKLKNAEFDIVHTIGGCCARRDVVTVQFTQRAWGEQLRQMALAERKARLSGDPPILMGRAWRRLYHALYWRLCDWLESPALRSRRVIAVSNGVRDELTQFYGTPEANVTVIYNGVEPAEWAPERLVPLRTSVRQDLGLAPDEAALLFVGDFYRKGLSTAIAALPGIAKGHLVVVGRGEIDAFSAQASALGVADRVHFVGFQRDVRPYFAAADLFVFPTRYEPFGMVITEAMAAGLPVVTTACAGAAEVITSGVDGIVLDNPEDARPFATAINALWADPEARLAMAEAARQTARRVDWDYVVRETLAVYRKVGV